MKTKIKQLKRKKKIFFPFILLSATPTIILCCSCSNIKMFNVLKFDRKKSKQLQNLNLHNEDAIVQEYLKRLTQDKQIFIDEWQNTLRHHILLAKKENIYTCENCAIGINNFIINENANTVSFILNVKCKINSLNNNDTLTTTIDGKYYFSNVKFNVKTYSGDHSFEKLSIWLGNYDWEINASEYITKVTKSNTKTIHTNTCKFKIENSMKIENFIEFFALISSNNEEDKLIVNVKKEKGEYEYLLNLESYYLAKQTINEESEN